MKKTSKLLILGSIFVASSCFLTGCNKDNFDGLTINFWHTFGKTVEDGIIAKANDFAAKVLKQEGVKLRIKMTNRGGYDDLKGEITKAFAVSGNPTITVAYPDHVADYFEAEATPGQFVVNMEDFVYDDEVGLGKEAYLGDEYGADDIIECYLRESTSYTREGFYSMPFLKSTEVMLYNFDLVKKAMPFYQPDVTQDDDIKALMNDLTWEDFMEFCEIIKDHKNEICSTLEVPAYYDSDSNLFITQMFQNGYTYDGIDDSGHGFIGFDGLVDNPTDDQERSYEGALDLLKQYKAWYNKGLFTTKGINGQYSSYYFTPQKTMFAIGSSGGSGYSFPATSEFRVEACKVPLAPKPAGMKDNMLYVSQGPTLCLLNNATLQKDGTNDKAVLYGWKFIKYLTNGKVNAQICTNNSEGYMPIRNSAYTTTEFIEFMASKTEYVKVARVIVEDIDNHYFVSHAFKGSATLRDQCGGAFADIMKSDGSASSIKNYLDKAITQTHLKM